MPTPHHPNLLDDIDSIDFKDQVDLVKLLENPNLVLTDSESEVKCTMNHLLKILKVIMYKIKIKGER